VERYNKNSDKPYTIQFSLGYAVYDPACGMDMDAFIKHLDRLMYEDKRRKLGAQEDAP
jgi:hypothetical protein